MKFKMITTHINRAMEDNVAALNTVMSRGNAFQTNHTDVAKVLGAIPTESKQSTSIITSVSPVDGTQCNIYCTISGLNGFKKGLVPKILSALMDIPNLTVSQVRSHPYPDYANVDYIVEFTTTTGYIIKVTLCCYLSSESKRCMQVPIGEETVTRTKYELRCM